MNDLHAPFDVRFGRIALPPLAHRLEKMAVRLGGCRVAWRTSIREWDFEVGHGGKGEGSGLESGSHVSPWGSEMSDREPQGCLSVILRLFGIKIGKPATSEDLPYRLRDDFLSPAELSFYKVLRLALKEKAIVCAKVNLSDIFFVARPNENRSFRNKIDRKHVDFLICQPDTMKPIAGVELDDSSHARKDRQERDKFVDRVFAAAGLPLVHFPAQRAYDPNAVAAELMSHLGKPRRAATPASESASNAHETPVCPKCDVPMVRRTATKGHNQGKQFWGCQNYPKCREVG